MVSRDARRAAGLKSEGAAIHRGAYYMSNWTGMLDPIRETGRLPSFFPVDLALPTVAPEDLGTAAAGRLLTPADDRCLRHIEGPGRLTPRNVADAFAEVLARPVEVDVIPREMWEQTFLSFGFSTEAAASYACMTAAVVDGETERPLDPVRGTTSLREYVGNVLRHRHGSGSTHGS